MARAPIPRLRALHHARPAVAAVGLERRPPNEPGHLPSARPEPCDPSGLRFARCSLAPRRPAPCRSPRAWACPVKGLLVASSYPLPPFTPLARCAAHAVRPLRGFMVARGKMRLTDFCNRLPSRAPCGLLDSRLLPFTRIAARPAHRCAPHALLRVARIAARPTHRCVGRSPAHPGPLALRRRGTGACRSAFRMRRPGGASLDGEPPASAFVATST